MNEGIRSRQSKYRIGVLASGSGTTFEAVHEATHALELADTEIAFVISNNGPTNPVAKVWEKAQRLHVPIFHISNLTQETCTVPIIGGEPATGTISYEASTRMADLADEHSVDMLVALGFMKKVIGNVLNKFPIAYAHPGPLPETAGKYGTGVQEEVMGLGSDFSGPTFHWMDPHTNQNGMPEYDTGQEIGHEPVAVTDLMKQEWDRFRSVDILKAEVMRVEKLCVPNWIHAALEQLR